jgi:hypothetical protein
MRRIRYFLDSVGVIVMFAATICCGSFFKEVSAFLGSSAASPSKRVSTRKPYAIRSRRSSDCWMGAKSATSPPTDWIV